MLDQGLTLAGAGDAQTVVNQKQRAVIGALNHGLAAIEKLVCNPFQRNTNVWALVVIDKNITVFFNYQKCKFIDSETFAG